VLGVPVREKRSEITRRPFAVIITGVVNAPNASNEIRRTNIARDDESYTIRAVIYVPSSGKIDASRKSLFRKAAAVVAASYFAIVGRFCSRRSTRGRTATLRARVSHRAADPSIYAARDRPCARTKPRKRRTVRRRIARSRNRTTAIIAYGTVIFAHTCAAAARGRRPDGLPNSNRRTNERVRAPARPCPKANTFHENVRIQSDFLRRATG